jgi:hypothetical protein
LRWRQNGLTRVLWLATRDSLFHRLLKDRQDPTQYLMRPPATSPAAATYDACLYEIGPSELTGVREIYDRIRPLVRDGGEIVVYVWNPTRTMLGIGYFGDYNLVFPDVDVAAIRFHGTRFTAALSRLYFRAAQSFPYSHIARGMMTGLALVALAPWSWLANRLGEAREPTIARSDWTSLVIEFRVRKGRDARAAAVAEGMVRIGPKVDRRPAPVSGAD